MERLVVDFAANPLAVVVLVVLVMSAIAAFVLLLRAEPGPTVKGWYTG